MGKNNQLLSNNNVKQPQFRMYTETGQSFLSLDPTSQYNPQSILSDPQALNLYSYARSNPIRYNDPDGRYFGQSIVNKIKNSYNNAVNKIATKIVNKFVPDYVTPPFTPKTKNTGGSSSTKKVLNSPVGNAKISSVFGEQRSYEVHPGTDYEVSVGTPVYATASGKVVRADYSDSYGNIIVINNGPVFFLQQPLGNAHTVFAHGSSFVASVGDNVNTGDLIMYSGNTGQKTTGPHLHYEVVVTPNPYPKNFYKNLDIRYGPDSLKDLLIKQF